MKVIIDYGFGKYGLGTYWYDGQRPFKGIVIRFEPEQVGDYPNTPKIIFPHITRTPAKDGNKEGR